MDHWDLLSETTVGVTTEYLVPNGLIRSFIRDGELFTVSIDALGSCRMVTDTDGLIVAQMEFDPWGRLLVGSFDEVQGGMPLGFVGAPGVRFDPITGLHYMRNRWYSCTEQRFISRDPIGLGAGQNQYTYCGSNPHNCIDPMGLDPGCHCPNKSPARLKREMDARLNLNLRRDHQKWLVSSDWPNYHIELDSMGNGMYTYNTAAEQAAIDASSRQARSWLVMGAGIQAGLNLFGGLRAGGGFSNAPRGPVGPPPRSAPPSPRVGLDNTALIDIIEFQRPGLLNGRRPDLSPVARRQFRDGGRIQSQLLDQFIWETGAVCDNDYSLQSGTRLVQDAAGVGRVIHLPDARIVAHALDRGHPIITGDNRIRDVLTDLNLGNFLQHYTPYRYGPGLPRD